jgi:hypothetical protein
MQGLIEDAHHKVYLVVDNLRAHRSHKVQEWDEEHMGQIELDYFPPYSP